MEQISTILCKTLEEVKVNAQKPPSLNPQASLATPLMNDNAGKAELASMLFHCFESCKVYGKEPEQLKSVNSMFQMVLADFTIEQIRQAFRFYLKHYSEMPAPADIAQIIMRGNKPPFDKTVYVSISKKPRDELTTEEWNYLKEYAQFILSGRY